MGARAPRRARGSTPRPWPVPPGPEPPFESLVCVRMPGLVSNRLFTMAGGKGAETRAETMQDSHTAAAYALLVRSTALELWCGMVGSLLCAARPRRPAPATAPAPSVCVLLERVLLRTPPRGLPTAVRLFFPHTRLGTPPSPRASCSGARTSCTAQRSAPGRASAWRRAKAASCSSMRASPGP